MKAALFILIALWPSAAGAQTDFSGVKLRVNDTIYVTRASGVEVTVAVACHCDEWGFRLESGLLYAAIGALVDKAHVGRTTVFRGRSVPLTSTGVAPLITSARRAFR
jgi:hypothetical protein